MTDSSPTVPACRPASDSANDEALVLTVVQAARLLGISRAHAYGLTRSGELPHVRLDRRILVPTQAIERLLRET